eukprot:Phypoly_transcript_03323.p1 GENE.Phypoly_transcript_03323~~Phypoly_transcript_03323.p1  ORF type:complete len:556 (+),score=48.61 Phypoly_transcript_03323:797-2464(+)
MEKGSITYKPANKPPQSDEKSYLLSKEQVVAKSSGFGGKTIGFFGGFSLLVSNLTGPGLVSLSLVYQNSGWLYPTVSLIVMMVMSTLSGVFLCEAMATIPGNESLQGRVEFATLARFYFGKKGHIVSQIFINTALQATNIAGIVISSQVLDSMFVHLFHNTCGLELHPRLFHWDCVSHDTQDESPFGDAFMLFTIGYLVVMVVVIPLGYLNLDDNIIIQVAALIFLVAVIVDWIATFVKTGLKNEVPAFTDLRQQAGVLGTIMFNFAYITTIPSWVNEKKPSVSVHQSLWSACIVSTITFFLVGYLGSRAFPEMLQDSDILSVINNSHYAGVVSRALVYLFPLMVLATSIPVYSIIVRYNLLQNNVVPKAWANIFAVVIPWAVAIPFMKGGALNLLMNWSSLLFASAANFVIPFAIYVKACEFRQSVRERLTEEQLEIIRDMHETEEETPKPPETEKTNGLLSTLHSHSNLPHVHTSIAHVQHHHYIVDQHHEHPLPDHDKNVNHHVVDNIPTPLPPNFIAVPHTTPQSARWIAMISAGIMIVLIVTVIVLAILF